MHIQQVQIKNFRCFEDLTVNLNPDVNIFVGNNGSGKSSVLDAIAAAIYPYVKVSQDIGNTTNRDVSPVIQLDLLVKKDNNTIRDLARFIVKTTDFPDWEVVYQKALSNEDSERLNIDDNEARSGMIYNKISENLNILTNDLLSQMSIIIYYKVNRNLTNSFYLANVISADFNRFDSLKNAFDAMGDFTDLVRWFFVREFQELREGKSKKDINFELHDLKQIRKAISTIIAPNANVYFAQNTSSKLMVEWKTETGEKIELSLNQLSSGYRNMLALVMDFARRLAQANPQMENPLEAEAVLMIDELDLHLHPTWQQKIIPDLRKVFPNTQIIATTHSPEIVTTVQRHQVKILENYQIKECPTPTRGRTSSDIVRDVLGLNNLRPDTKESKTLAALFDAIDNSNLEEAKKLREELQDWEMFDAEITRADMQIQRLKRKLSA